MSRKAAVSLFLAGVGILLWLPATSALVVLLLHRWGELPPSVVPLAALYFWRDYGGLPSVREALLQAAAGGAVVAMVPAALVLFGSNRDRLQPALNGAVAPSPKRALSTAHGGAEWLSIKAARELFPGPHPTWGGVVVGEAYRPDLKPSQGGKAPLLIDPCKHGSTHGTVYAGSGGYKTVSVTIPTLLHWTGSAVVFDPPDQVGPMTEAARCAMGQAVYTIAPGRQSMNVLSWIDPSAPSAEVDVLDVLNWIGGDLADTARGENAAFAHAGRNLLACLLLDLLWNPATPPDRRTLRELRRRVTTPERDMKRLLQDIAEGSHSAMARDLARSVMDIHAKTFSGAYFHATGETAFLAIKAYADMLSDEDCDPTCICTGKATVYLAISMRDIAAAPALARVLVATFQSALRRAEGRVATGRVLFLLDEARFLGRLSTLAAMMTADRKYGATVITLWQDESDQKAIWKDRAGIFAANSSWTLYAAVNDLPTSEKVSALAGKYTVITRTTGSGSSVGDHTSRNRSNNDGLSEAARPLIMPEEVRTMPADEAIIFRRGSAPLRAGRAIYYRRPEMVARVQADRLRQAA